MSFHVKDPEQPLVSAILLVGKVPVNQIQLAVNCFARQTYENRELVIVNNCNTLLAAAELQLDLPDQPAINIVDTDTQLTAGMARNYGISVSNGDIIIQFDAHCWHAPQRIAEQVTALLRYNANICLLQRCLEYSYASGYGGYWRTDKNCILNSMAFYNPTTTVSYANIDKAEELIFLQQLINNGYKPIAIERPELMLRYHYSKIPVAHKQVMSLPGAAKLSSDHLKLIKRILYNPGIKHVKLTNATAHP